MERKHIFTFVGIVALAFATILGVFGLIVWLSPPEPIQETPVENWTP